MNFSQLTQNVHIGFSDKYEGGVEYMHEIG